MGKDRLAEARILAEDLLADIELTRMGAEQILLKGVRLARLIGDETSLRWLELELHGYEFTDETRSTLEQMRRTFKHKDGTQRAYVIPLGSIEGNIRAEEKRLTSLGAPSLSGEYLPSALDRVHAQINGATASIMTYTQIRSAVLAQIHAFAARTFHELTFSERQEELFEAARRDIDGMLAPVSAKALAKVESITERLGRGDEEAISQAMSTCRRLIDSFADAVSPPQTEPTVVDGQPMEVSSRKCLIVSMYVRQHTQSKSRQQRLRQALRGIYERVSAGVHDDVTPSEARFLFLETYVALGEILALAPLPALSAQVPNAST